MKKVLFLASALIMSTMMFAAEKTLTFDLSKNPGGWPTANSTELTEYIYTLGDVDYSFYLKNVKCNSGYLMLTQPAALGLPAIEGYKLTKVVAKNTSGCSTSVNVGISYSSESAEYLSGGEAQTWATQSSSYTYELNETSDNVVYYLYVTKKNAQVTELELTYTSGVTPQRTLQSIYIDGEATKLEYREGESFEPTGLKVMGVYDSGDDTEITAGIEWTIVPGTLTLGTTSVDVTAQHKDFTSEVFTVNNIVVTEKPAPSGYADTYTSNVELSTEGGISATAVQVKIDGTEYDAIKAGTGKVKGACVVSIPANTKTLHFHAAAWNKEVVKLDVNGTTYDLVADAAIAGSGTSYELQNDPATQDYFTFDPKGATTITFTASADAAGFRFVLFGVNAELDTPTAMQEVMENANVSKQLINGQLIIIRDNVRYNVAGQQL